MKAQRRAQNKTKPALTGWRQPCISLHNMIPIWLGDPFAWFQSGEIGNGHTMSPMLEVRETLHRSRHCNLLHSKNLFWTKLQYLLHRCWYLLLQELFLQSSEFKEPLNLSSPGLENIFSGDIANRASDTIKNIIMFYNLNQKNWFARLLFFIIIICLKIYIWAGSLYSRLQLEAI